MAINIRQRLEFLTGDDAWSLSANRFPPNADPELFYTILKEYDLQGMHIGRFISSFDGFIRAGLGSSASSAVCLIAALMRIKGILLDKASIAQEAWRIETQNLGWFGGKQDQYASSFGGLNLIEFGKTVTVNPLEEKSAEKLLQWSFLTYVGGARSSHPIQKTFESPTEEQKKIFDAMKYKIVAARVWLETGYMSGVGELLDEAWNLKKQSNPAVSNERIDELYTYARENGAVGGKLLGAGQGGYMYFVVPPERRSAFKTALRKKGMEEIDFSIDWNGVEARIL